MQKSKLLEIAQKYNLGGLNETAVWTIEDSKCTINVRHNSCLFAGIFNDVSMPDTSFVIPSTSAFISQISALDDEFEMGLVQHQNKAVRLSFSDSAIDMQYALGDPELEAYQKTNTGLKSVPDFGVKVELDIETMTRYIRSKSALKTCDLFAVQTVGNTVELILNYNSDNNVNQIKMQMEGEVANQINKPILFDAEVVKTIFNTNKNPNCKILFEVSGAGLLKISFENTDYTIIYYLPKMGE